ncbi:MAG: LD-carboxypeptidase [Marinicaulis sp.]|nr:LD-carboxypeptidase [Marinicaulis sp.]
MTNTTKHIALVCPGGPITRELADKVVEIAALQQGGHHGKNLQLHFHDQCFLTSGHFAGSDEARSAAFLEVANDPKFDAVWFARGGYGASRLDDKLFAKLNEHARKKTYLGYSDAGVLLARLYGKGIGCPTHGPMPTDISRSDGKGAITRALDYLVNHDPGTLEPSAKLDKKTTAFNITVLSHMVGARWMPDLSDHIIMLEDIGEYLYRIDRAMFTITDNPNIREAAGIMLGRISDILENDRPFGQTEEEIVQYWCVRAGVPYLGRADIGHDSDNKIVPFGMTASL